MTYADMAYAYPDDDLDSSFGEEAYPLDDPMLAPLTASLAGTKRDVDHVLDDAQTANSGLAAEREHPAEDIGPSCPTRHPEQPAPCDPMADGRPSKRRASALKVSEFQNAAGESSALNSNTGHQFADTRFETSRRGYTPCADADCAQKPVCYNPTCDQKRECSDRCADPDCTKLACPDDRCYCQTCDAQPCPLGDGGNKCHLDRSAPDTSGTDYRWDDNNRHFQEDDPFSDFNLSAAETYPYLSLTHGAPGQCNTTAPPLRTLTPIFSPSNYTSLNSFRSSQSSPAPGLDATPDCFLGIPWDHCHRGGPCCHLPTRKCGEYPAAPQDHVDMWNLSLGQGGGMNASSGYMGSDFGLQTALPANTLSLALPSSVSTTLNSGMTNEMLGFWGSPWTFPHSQPSTAFPSSREALTNLDFLSSTIQEDMSIITSHDASRETSTIGTAANSPTDPETACICKWQHAPYLICNQTFESPETLHKHIKSSHIDSCARCFCQWEACDAGDKDFKQRSKLGRHLLGHAGYRPYACGFEGCNKTFATNQAKDNHERTHTGDRPYACDRCEYTTATYTQLQTHINSLHLKQKPHKCRFCDFTSADSSNMSKHEKTHQSLRPYHCPHAGCTFKPDYRWENLKRHLRRTGHCAELLVEGSEEHKAYRDEVKRETEEWHRRNEGSLDAIGGRKKGRKPLNDPLDT